MAAQDPTLAAKPVEEKTPLERLGSTLPQKGRLDWIGLRPGRREALRPVPTATVTAAGLDGDRGRAGKRAITLIQAEHLPAIAALVGWPAPLHPGLLRRNLVISGINLLALKGRRFRIGDVVLEGTQPCHPCSRMEEALGPGGWNAMRGHGGLCARVVVGGSLEIGDPVSADG